MAFTSYITYEEYTALGGKVSETDFPNLERKAQRWIDYFTFNRIPKLTVIPDEVKEVLVELMNIVDKYEHLSTGSQTSTTSTMATNGMGLLSYSNGVESLRFDSVSSTDLQKQENDEMQKIVVSWLPLYLTARSVNFDVEQYIQSDSNNS